MSPYPLLLLGALWLALPAAAQTPPPDLYTRRIEFRIGAARLSVPFNYLPPSQWEHPPAPNRFRPFPRDFTIHLVWPDLADPARPEALHCTEVQGMLCAARLTVSVSDLTPGPAERWLADAPRREPELLGRLWGLAAQRERRTSGSTRPHWVRLHMEAHPVFGFVSGGCVAGSAAPADLAVFGRDPSSCNLRFELVPGADVAVLFRGGLLPEWDAVLSRVRALLVEWQGAAG